MDTPEMIWGRALAVHRPDILVLNSQPKKPGKKLHFILSILTPILTMGPMLLVVFSVVSLG